MVFAKSGDLRQVRNANQLIAPGEGAEFAGNLFGGHAANAGVHFVEDQSTGPGGPGAGGDRHLQGHF